MVCHAVVFSYCYFFSQTSDLKTVNLGVAGDCLQLVTATTVVLNLCNLLLFVEVIYNPIWIFGKSRHTSGPSVW